MLGLDAATIGLLDGRSVRLAGPMTSGVSSGVAAVGGVIVTSRLGAAASSPPVDVGVGVLVAVILGGAAPASTAGVSASSAPSSSPSSNSR